MGSIYDEITRLETAKTDIETAIEACGVDVPDTKLISDYASYIRQIPSAVFSELNVDPVGGDDKYIKTIELQNGLISATIGGLVSSTSSGLAPKIGTAASSTISVLANEWVLTSTKGESPTWRKLPSNAFKNDNTNTTYSLSGALSGNTYITTLTDSASDTTTATVPAMSGASSTAAGAAGLVPAPAANKHTAFLRGDGTWVVPTNTNYYRPISVNGTSILGNNNTALNLVAGTNISIIAENSSGYTGKVTITNTGVRSVTTGTTNGTISVDTNGTTANVAVKGLGTAAYTKSSEYIRQVNLGKKLVDVKDIWTNLELYWGNARSVLAQFMDDSGYWGHLFFKSQNRRLSEYGVDAAGLFMRGGMFQRWAFSGKDTEEDPLVLNKYKIYDESNLTVVSSSDNGLTPKVINTNTATVGSAYYVLASTNGSASPSWYKLPTNAFANDDTKVTQTNTTGSAYYRVLLSGNANDTTETTTARKSTNLLFNPSTGCLKSKYILTEGILSSVASDLETLSKSGNNLIYKRFIKTIFTNETGITVTGNANGVLWVGTHSPEASNNTEVGYGHMLGFTGGTGGLYHKIVVNGDLSQSWKQIAYTTSDITGNAATADKLKTKRKLWGLDFDGTADVKGTITIGGGLTDNKSIIFPGGEYLDGAGNFHLDGTTETVNAFHIFKTNSDGTRTSLFSVSDNNSARSTGTFIAPTFQGNLDGYYVNKLTGYSKATSASNLATTDTLNSALGKLEYKAHYAYNWVTTVTATDTDEYINKWGEIVGFLDSVKEGTDILDEFVTRKTDLTITGAKTFSKLVTFSATPGILVTRSSGVPYFRFGKDASNVYGAIGASNEGNICVYNDVTGSGWHIVLHSNNYTSYLPILNSSSTHATKSSVIYAPTSGGTSGYILKSNGSSEPTWINPTSLTVGTAQHLQYTGGNTGSDKNQGLWFLVGELVRTDVTKQINSNVLFYVTDYYQRHTFGLIRIEIRVNSNATTPSVSSTKVLWVLNNGFDPANLLLSYKQENRIINNVEQEVTVLKIYIKANDSTWSAVKLVKISDGGWASEGDSDCWTLLSKRLTSLPDNETYIVSEIAPIHNQLSNTLTFSAGAFSAKTYNNSAAITVNIPTHTSHLTNNSGFLTQHLSLANYVTLDTELTITGKKTFKNSLTINSTATNQTPKLVIDEYYSSTLGNWISEIISDYYGKNICSTTNFTHGLYIKLGRSGFNNLIILNNDYAPIARISKEKGHWFNGTLTIDNGVGKSTIIYSESQSATSTGNTQTVIKGINFTHKLVLKDSFAGGCNYATLSGGYSNEGKLTLQSFTIDTTNNTATVKATTTISTGNSTFAGNVFAPKFITSGGTSSQFVKGDGSLDGNKYLINTNTTHTSAYYRLMVMNGTTYAFWSHSSASSFNVYAPTSAGTQGLILISNGTGAPGWTTLSYLKFALADNGGRDTYLLISDLSNWKEGTSSDISLIGTIYGHRGGNLSLTDSYNIVAQCTSYTGGTTLTLYTNTYTTRTVLPYIVKYNNKNYLALKKRSSGGNIYFIGYTSQLLKESEYITLNVASGKTLPDGMEIVHSPSFTEYSISTNKLFDGENHRTILHSGNYTSYVNTTNFPGLNKTGTVTSVKVGSTSYSPSSGVVSLPAYPTSLKSPNAIKFKNTDGTEVSYDGSAAVDLTGGVYNAKQLNGNAETSYLRYRGEIDTSYVDLTDTTKNHANFKKPSPGMYAVSRTGISEMFISFAMNTGSCSSLEFKVNYTDTSRLYIRKVIDSNRISGDWRGLAWHSDIPTKVSQLTNDSGFLTSRGYIGTTAVQASSAAQALTGITNLTMNGTYTNNNKLIIHSSGCVYPYSTSTRTAGMYGKYDSTKVGHVWSMGTDFKIADDGSSTNNMYGLVYFHTNWSNSATNNATKRDDALITEVSNYAGGHQIAFVVKGQVKVALGDRVWSRAGFLKSGSSDSYVLLGGGGHKALSDFLLETEFASKELSSNLTTITKTLTVTKDWMDTGIKYTDLATGTYAIQVYTHASSNSIYYCYWSGIMTWYGSPTNSSDSDEILLHRGAHAYNGNTIYLRTIHTAATDGRHMRLQIAANKNWSSATFTFNFKKLI